jgi:hypothetical protein
MTWLALARRRELCLVGRQAAGPCQSQKSKKGSAAEQGGSFDSKKVKGPLFLTEFEAA